MQLESSQLSSQLRVIRHAPGLEGNEIGGVRSTMETVLSVPHAQPQNKLLSDFATNVLFRSMATGFAMVKMLRYSRQRRPKTILAVEIVELEVAGGGRVQQRLGASPPFAVSGSSTCPSDSSPRTATLAWTLTTMFNP